MVPKPPTETRRRPFLCTRSNDSAEAVLRGDPKRTLRFLVRKTPRISHSDRELSGKRPVDTTTGRRKKTLPRQWTVDESTFLYNRDVEETGHRAWSEYILLYITYSKLYFLRRKMVKTTLKRLFPASFRHFMAGSSEKEVRIPSSRPAYGKQTAHGCHIAQTSMPLLPAKRWKTRCTG